MSNENLSLLERLTAPTPTFFKKLRNIGLFITATSAAILTSPVFLPGLIIKVAGYLAVAGGVISAISQSTVKQE